MRLGSLKANNY